jgi:pilus assembly protein CpaE
MDTWIISESDDITARVRKSLQKLDLECPLARVVSAASVGQLALQSFDEPAVVFFTASSVSPDHLYVLRQLRMEGDAKVVVVAPVADHAVVLKAIRAGASDFLNAEGNLDDELADLLARFKAERVQRSAKGRLIAIVPCQVPSDASMLAVNVAAVLARNGAGCGLLDFQLRGGDLAMLLKLSPRHTLYDLITQRESVDETMFQQALTSHESGIRLLAGPPLFSDFGNMQTHVCQHILGLAQASHSYVIVNSEDILHAEQVRALASSDDIVLTMRLDLVSLYRAQQHLAYLRRNHVLSEHIHLVAMGTGHAGELPVHSVKKVLGVSQLDCIPDDPVATMMSINIGNPLVLEAPTAKISQAIVKFASSLSELPAAADEESQRKTSAGLRAAAVLTLNALPFCSR